MPVNLAERVVRASSLTGHVLLDCFAGASISLVAYGAATWDWYAIHYDLKFAKASKLTAPLVDGQMFGALLAQQAKQNIPSARCFALH